MTLRYDSFFVVGFAALLISGCAPSASRLNGLHVGMTKREAIKQLGNPRSTTARGGVEVLQYSFTDKPFGDGMIFPGSYYVTLDNGRVVGWQRDEAKDRLDRERAYRMNTAGVAGLAAQPVPAPAPQTRTRYVPVGQGVRLSPSSDARRTREYIVTPGNPVGAPYGSRVYDVRER